MVVKTLVTSNFKLLISIAIVIVAVLLRKDIKVYYDNYVNGVQEEKDGILSTINLAQFDGIQQKKLYLAVLGTVFDVTEGKRHYKKGAAYNYFVGKDGSRALITGNFKDETDLKDHVLDLSCNDLLTLVSWQKTFRNKYIEVGVLIGRYYNKNGEETAYTKEFYHKIKQCEIEKENSRKEDQKFPPCNIAWSADEGSKVWCTTSSGGVKRSWAGVPRQLYTPGVEKPRCVCLNIIEQDSQGLVKEYDNCPKLSTECKVTT